MQKTKSSQWFSPAPEGGGVMKRNGVVATCIKIKFLILTMLGLVSSVHAATWYVDKNATGANNGTSWANAWTSMTAVSGVAAGDTVYISGGSTSTTYPLSSWTPAGGVAGNPITYRTGQDAGHNGTVIFDVQRNNFWLMAVNNVTISGEVNGAQHMIVTNASDVVVYGDNAKNLSLRYINFPNMVGGFRVINVNGFELGYCTVQKIPHPTGRLDYFLLGLTGNGFDQNKIHHNTISVPSRTGDSGWGDDGIQWASSTSIYDNRFKVYLTNYPGTQHADMMQIGGSWIRVYNNVFENVGESLIYHDVYNTPAAIHDVQIYNNICYWSMAPASSVARGFELQPEAGGLGTTFTDCFIANNTFVDFTSIFTIRWNNAASYTRCYVINNIFYNCVSPMADMSPAAPGMNIMYNKAVAGARGTSSINPPNTAGPGGSGTVQFKSYSPYNGNNDFHLVAADTGARDAGSSWPSTYFTKDKDGVSRPQGAAWDIGAYEFGGTASTNQPPTVSAITQSVADADPNVPGIQIVEGTAAQYSGTASDPNGNPLTWQWVYTVNGGSEVVNSSGSGTVSPTSFTYPTGSAGKTYVWKLRANDGQASAESQLTVAVTAKATTPPAGTYEAELGALTGPFTVANGAISQSTQTGLTDGGRAAYTINITNNGSYVIQALVNAPSTGENSFFVNIDGEPQDPTMIWDIPVTTGFENRIVSWRGNGTDATNQFVPKVFKLNPGSHQVIIRGREADVQLDRFILLQAPQPPHNLRLR